MTLSGLRSGHPGISEAFGAALAEAAVVCLESQGHRTGKRISATGTFQRAFILAWEILQEEAQRSWADSEVATEFGAYGVAALVVKALTGQVVLERSRKGTGFDFWLGPPTAQTPLFQGKSRLEISGIRKGTERQIQARVASKLRQTERSDATLTLRAIVAVVEFGAPRTEVRVR
ncbi:MAG: hypothetical protein KDD47_06665 [Acidobacteria bacterium]|nr:hypothetical protein [Acidobacteriota bacterium]